MFYDASITIDLVFIPYTVAGLEPAVAGLEPTVAPEAVRVGLTVIVQLALLV